MISLKAKMLEFSKIWNNKKEKFKFIYIINSTFYLAKYLNIIVHRAKVYNYHFNSTMEKIQSIQTPKIDR